ncbi:MAG: TRAP transporter small permease [Thermodesulfobacteriota bacterium]
MTKNLIKIVDIVDQGIAKGEAVVLGFLLALLTLVVFLQVLFRYVLTQPLSWSEEMARYLFVWLSILGAALGVQKKGHFGLDFFQRMLPEKMKGVLGLIMHLLMIMVTMVILYQGVRLVQMTRLQESAAMAISMAWAYGALPVGAGLMTIHLLTGFCKRLWPEKKPGEMETISEPGR